MFQDGALYSIAMFAAAAWLFKMWICDLRGVSRPTERRARGNSPGRGRRPLGLSAAGVLCGLVLLAGITAAEIASGEVGEQTKVSFWALFSWVGAAFIEELVFRGYLVVESRGRVALWGSVFAFSLLFALCHPFFWDFSVPEGGSVFDGVFSLDFSAKAFRDSANVFVSSLAFYILRFCPQNGMRSLIPCVAAHLAYNVGVFCVKAAQGLSYGLSEKEFSVFGRRWRAIPTARAAGFSASPAARTAA